MDNFLSINTIRGSVKAPRPLSNAFFKPIRFGAEDTFHSTQDRTQRLLAKASQDPMLGLNHVKTLEALIEQGLMDQDQGRQINWEALQREAEIQDEKQLKRIFKALKQNGYLRKVKGSFPKRYILNQAKLSEGLEKPVDKETPQPLVTSTVASSLLEPTSPITAKLERYLDKENHKFHHFSSLYWTLYQEKTGTLRTLLTKLSSESDELAEADIAAMLHVMQDRSLVETSADNKPAMAGRAYQLKYDTSGFGKNELIRTLKEDKHPPFSLPPTARAILLALILLGAEFDPEDEPSSLTIATEQLKAVMDDKNYDFVGIIHQLEKAGFLKVLENQGEKGVLGISLSKTALVNQQSKTIPTTVIKSHATSAEDLNLSQKIRDLKTIPESDRKILAVFTELGIRARSIQPEGIGISLLAVADRSQVARAKIKEHVTNLVNEQYLEEDSKGIYWMGEKLQGLLDATDDRLGSLITRIPGGIIPPVPKPQPLEVKPSAEAKLETQLELSPQPERSLLEKIVQPFIGIGNRAETQEPPRSTPVAKPKETSKEIKPVTLKTSTKSGLFSIEMLLEEHFIKDTLKLSKPEEVALWRYLVNDTDIGFKGEHSYVSLPPEILAKALQQDTHTVQSSLDAWVNEKYLSRADFDTNGYWLDAGLKGLCKTNQPNFETVKPKTEPVIAPKPIEESIKIEPALEFNKTEYLKALSFDLDLKGSERKVLKALAQQEGISYQQPLKITLSELSAKTGIVEKILSGLTNELEKTGYLQKIPNGHLRAYALKADSPCFTNPIYQFYGKETTTSEQRNLLDRVFSDDTLSNPAKQFYAIMLIRGYMSTTERKLVNTENLHNFTNKLIPKTTFSKYAWELGSHGYLEKNTDRGYYRMLAPDELTQKGGTKITHSSAEDAGNSASAFTVSSKEVGTKSEPKPLGFIEDTPTKEKKADDASATPPVEPTSTKVTAPSPPQAIKLPFTADDLRNAIKMAPNFQPPLDNREDYQRITAYAQNERKYTKILESLAALGYREGVWVPVPTAQIVQKCGLAIDAAEVDSIIASTLKEHVASVEGGYLPKGGTPGFQLLRAYQEAVAKVKSAKWDEETVLENKRELLEKVLYDHGLSFLAKQAFIELQEDSKINFDKPYLKPITEIMQALGLGSKDEEKLKTAIGDLLRHRYLKITPTYDIRQRKQVDTYQLQVPS